MHDLHIISWVLLLQQVNYARNDASCVEKVKELYEVMNIKQLYFDYEDNSYQKLSKLVDQCSQWLPPDLFLEYMEKLYKRNVWIISYISNKELLIILFTLMMIMFVRTIKCMVMMSWRCDCVFVDECMGPVNYV